MLVRGIELEGDGFADDEAVTKVVGTLVSTRRVVENEVVLVVNTSFVAVLVVIAVTVGIAGPLVKSAVAAVAAASLIVMAVKGAYEDEADSSTVAISLALVGCLLVLACDVAIGEGNGKGSTFESIAVATGMNAVVWFPETLEFDAPSPSSLPSCALSVLPRPTTKYAARPPPTAMATRPERIA